MIAGVLGARYIVKSRQARAARVAVGYEAEAAPGGWLAELKREPLPMDPGKPRIMLAARGQNQAEFAVDLARRRGAALFVIYVRTFRLLDTPPGVVPSVEDDAEALESRGAVAVLARRYGVPFFPGYVCSPDIAEEILDYTVTFGCDTLILGKTRRKAFARAIEGDVVSRIATHLPTDVALITRDASPHPMGPPPSPSAEDKLADAPGPTGQNRPGK
jgi:nucleotide-binding universal stress UspA family protein